MNASQITHIFWKEYRTQRGLWLGVLSLIVSIQLMIWLGFRDDPRPITAPLFVLGAVLTLIYSIASAGVMFAGEKEERTYEWLRSLPVARVQFFTGKMLWLLASTSGVFLIVSLVAALPNITQLFESGYLSKIGPEPEIYRDAIVLGSSLILSGICFSLICQRIYSALGLSVVAFVTSISLYSLQELRWFVLMTVSIALATVWQGRRWLYPTPLLENFSFRLPERTWNLTDALAAAPATSPVSKTVRRHLWLEWRNARTMVLTFALVPIAFLLSFGQHTGHFWSSFLLLGVAPLSFGLGTCRAEQNQDRYRFQTNLGVSPGLLWGIKQLVWGGMYLSLLFVYACVLYFWMVATSDGNRFIDWMLQGDVVRPHFDRYRLSLWPVTCLTLSFTFCLYAVGHIFSLLCKRTIIAGLFSVLSACAVVFLTQINIQLDVSLLIALVMSAVLMMGFSYVRTADWLLDRDDPQDKRRLAGVLCLLGLMCITSWIVWRVAELLDSSVFVWLNTTLCALFPAFLYPLIYLPHTAGWTILVFLFSVIVMSTLIWRCRTWRGVAVGYGILHVLIGLTFVTHFTLAIRSRGEAIVQADDSWPAPDSEAVITGQMYRTAQDDVNGKMVVGGQWVGSEKLSGLFSGEEDISDEWRVWLDQNQTVVGRLIDISARADCAPENPYLLWSSDENWIVSTAQAGNETFLLLRLNALIAEQEGRLADAWTSHLANVRMFRHTLQWQMPIARSGLSTRFTGRTAIQYDLHRWIEHSAQTPELLKQAAADLDAIFRTMPRLDEAYLLQSGAQSKALLEDDVVNWSNLQQTGPDPGRGLLFLLNELPWERQRAVSLTWILPANLASTARSIDQGYDAYAEEIAGSSIEPMRGLPETYAVVPLWERELSRSRIELIEQRWRLADTTPLLIASYYDPIPGYGIGPVRPVQELIEEVNLVRQRRLLSLHCAVRISELLREVPLRGTWSQKLQEIRWDALTESVLARAEDREGRHTSRSGEVNKDWMTKQLLYYDPVTGQLFEDITIDRWGR